MDLRAYSRKARAAGARDSEDTILAHITPEEAALLRSRGGSGRIDPTTGLPHFDAGGKRGDSHAGNASGGYGGGDSDGGGNGGTGRTSKTGTSNPANSRNYGSVTGIGGNSRSVSTPAVDMNAARAAVYSTPAERAAIAAGNYSSADAGYDGFSGRNISSMTPGMGYTTTPTNWKGALAGGAKTLAALAKLAAGNIIGGGVGLYQGAKQLSSSLGGTTYHDANGDEISGGTSRTAGGFGNPGNGGNNGNGGRDAGTSWGGSVAGNQQTNGNTTTATPGTIQSQYVSPYWSNYQQGYNGTGTTSTPFLDSQNPWMQYQKGYGS